VLVVQAGGSEGRGDAVQADARDPLRQHQQLLPDAAPTLAHEALPAVRPVVAVTTATATAICVIIVIRHVVIIIIR
jgi:hypothetical protein